MTSFKTECPSPVGLLTLASDGENLTGYAGGLDKSCGFSATKASTPPI